MTDTNLRLGIDFGGTKTEIIGLNAHNGKELYRKRIATVRDDYQKTLESFEALVLEAEKNLGQIGTLGMGIPGSVSKDTGSIKNSNSVWMNGKPLKEDLEAILKREIRFQNDANCFAVSEATDGAAQGADVVFGVIIGTGCGGGVVINGKPLMGVNGIGGEWGHNPLPNPRIYVPNNFKPEKFESLAEENPLYPNITHDKDWNEMPGPICYCGRRNCQELWLSGTGFKLDYQRVTGENLTTHDVMKNARLKEPKAVAALTRYVDRLARGLGNVINLLDPDVIVLGGGMGNVSTLYDEVPKVWGKYIFSDYIHTKLKPPIHGDSSGVRGAAWLWNKDSE
ncbi:MAG: ROK family protein [Alphaproteobacteria bacterium]|nr:ROK family protein [Alphaproteobacteria bacterium]NCQ88664.1 ROK family protein [Alphaproteobacteria bacterium]NCT06207.1 ROK family protein [Alphaproteobacteria bacterium]